MRRWLVKGSYQHALCVRALRFGLQVDWHAGISDAPVMTLLPSKLGGKSEALLRARIDLEAPIPLLS